jgi:hypothetical protein
MRTSVTIAVMFISSFIIQYFFMSTIMIDRVADFTFNLSKIYMSVIMGLFMAIVEIIMHDHNYNVFSKKLYLLFGSLLLFFVYAYRTQLAVRDKQYLEEMIEHHSMALVTSKRILEKTDDYKVTKLAKDILRRQNEEIVAIHAIIHHLDE